MIEFKIGNIEIFICNNYRFNKHDWYINLLPVLNIGNQVYGKGFVINFRWIVFNFSFNLFYKR